MQTQIENLTKIIVITISILFEGSGVFIAALFALSLLKKERTTSITLLGTSKIYNAYMVAIPLVLLAVVGVNNTYEMNVHVYAIFAFIITLIYCIFEEYGWRGYLHEEFKSITPIKKYIIIGILWYM
ncbi:hypothetical protein OAX11_03780 [Flavobacteriaceae bacterium]|nr:hypothetical protein [Flavobacteriaceae bacterium]